jgi:hypothetical protein
VDSETLLCDSVEGEVDRKLLFFFFFFFFCCCCCCWAGHRLVTRAKRRDRELTPGLPCSSAGRADDNSMMAFPALFSSIEFRNCC